MQFNNVPLQTVPLTTTPQKKRHITVKTTGYASMGLLLASGFAAMNKKTIKCHKYLGWLGLLASTLHLGLCLGKKHTHTPSQKS